MRNDENSATNFKSAVVTVLERENILNYKGPNYFWANAICLHQRKAWLKFGPNISDTLYPKHCIHLKSYSYTEPAHREDTIKASIHAAAKSIHLQKQKNSSK